MPFLRKQRQHIDGPYLKAKIIQYVREDTNVDREKAEAFKASNKWLQGFKNRKGITLRVRTNKKSKSAIKRSRLVTG